MLACNYFVWDNVELNTHLKSLIAERGADVEIHLLIGIYERSLSISERDIMHLAHQK